ncbi:putative family oxidoreductase [Fusarium denticulatum]|uniref:Putative family oxidoreductase n=1 Tax=Fusarium denticulatum TaxID=48507 RepID=A0A8H5WWV3_9HYPO|nr:putative family oxidoreductase [Fusarium denticulatum]
MSAFGQNGKALSAVDLLAEDPVYHRPVHARLWTESDQVPGWHHPFLGASLLRDWSYPNQSGHLGNVELIESHQRVYCHPLKSKSHEIVQGIRGVVCHDMRCRGRTINWSPSMECSCIRFFSPPNLDRFMEAFWHFWYPNWPVFHRPTFIATQKPAQLIAALSLIGACVSPEKTDRDQAMLWIEAVGDWIHHDPEFSEDAVPQTDDEVQLLQLELRLDMVRAAYAIILIMTWEGNGKQMTVARRTRFSQVICVARSLFFFPIAQQNVYGGPDPSNHFQSWMLFALREECIRILIYVFLLDCAFVMFFNSAPRMVISELQFSLAKPEACFNALTPEMWLNHLKEWSECQHTHHELTLFEAIRVILKAELKPKDWEMIQKMSLLNLFAITCAFHNLIFHHHHGADYGSTSLSITRGLRNWLQVWTARDVVLVQGQPSQVSHPKPSEGGSTIGFYRYIREYWCLAVIYHHQFDNDPAFKKAATEAAVSCINDYAQRSVFVMFGLYTDFYDESGCAFHAGGRPAEDGFMKHEIASYFLPHFGYTITFPLTHPSALPNQQILLLNFLKNDLRPSQMMKILNSITRRIRRLPSAFSSSALHRTHYTGSLLFNLASFILPALYGTLSKLWVANIDSSMVVLTDAYTYMNTASEAVNEGLPRAAWVIIGDKASRSLGKRLQLTHTLIAFQSVIGLILSIIFVAAASSFANSFVPEEVRDVSTIIALGSVYATAWGVFNTIRWGLIMVPVQALEATASQFIGHNWGDWRRRVDISTRKPQASLKGLRGIIRPAFRSLLIALIFEVPIAIFLTLFGAKPFASYISDSEEVAEVTAYMWQSLDWCYIFYATSTQLATILLATRPRWYLYQSLATRTAKRLKEGNLPTLVPDGFPKQLNGDLVWEGDSVGQSYDWTYKLSEDQLGEIDQALQHFKGLGLSLGHLSTETFPLPKLHLELRKLSDELHKGHGFFVIRGVNVDNYTREENAIIYVGISSHIASQRGRQDSKFNGKPADVVLTHVKDLSAGQDKSAIGSPAYTTDRQVFHTDSGDIVSLFCLETALEGGASRIASTWRVYNELAKTRPDLIHTLSQNWDVENFANPNKKFTTRPLLYHQNATDTLPERVALQYARRYFVGFGALPRSHDIPPITEAQAEALDALHFLGDKLSVSTNFAKGDMQFINNLAVFHARDAFTDSPSQQ